MCQQIFTCITGSFRLLLFFGSLLLGIVAVGLAAEVSWVRSFYTQLDAPDWKQNLSYLFACAVYLIVLTVAGSLGAFYNNKRVIRFFTLLLVVNIVVCVVVVAYLPSQQESELKFSEKLNSSLSKYSFKKGDNSTVNAFWDQLQADHVCCGLSSPKDWLPLSPNRHSFAKSCCKDPEVDGSDNQYCSHSDSQMGCLRIAYGPIFLVLGTLVLAMALSVPLALIACISGCGTRSGHHQAANH